MKTTFTQEQWRGKSLWAAAAVLGLGLASAPAQLAITEVMSSAATTYQGNPVLGGSDFFEVTNFGTNSMDLTDYSFTDARGGPPSDGSACFDGLTIGPGESAVFFRSNNLLSTVEHFTTQWGSCLRTDKFRHYGNVGFNAFGDGIRLKDPLGNPVDEVDFGAAMPGVTFVSDPDTGNFGAYSMLGVCGTCQAAAADDIGSPGTNHCGSVPLRIVKQPTALPNLCSGLDAVFRVRVHGLPRPKYQWFFNGDLIPGANAATLTLPDAQSVNEGEYRVVVTNGVETALSEPAYLTVDTNPSAPRFLSRLTDIERFEKEKATFTAQVCAFPRPVFQWYSNGVPIVGATNRTLVLPNLTLSMAGRYRVDITNTMQITNCMNVTNPMGGRYCVNTTNAVNWIRASGRLFVYPRPQLEITEVMLAPSINGGCGGRANWWELTNTGTNACNLKGFRHSDVWDLPGAKVVTNDLVLRPEESVVFVEAMTREAFIGWWGADNLPPELKVITYVGYGLRAWGEPLWVWSAAAEEATEALASVVPASTTPFPRVPPTCPCRCDTALCDHPIYGHSLFFRFSDSCSRRGLCNEEGQNGAFRAAECDDVGSPGWSPWAPPYWTSIHREPAGLVLRWKAQLGSTNCVEYTPSLEDPHWTNLACVSDVGASRTFTDTSIGTVTQRFYRITCLPNGQTSEVIQWPPAAPRIVRGVPGPDGRGVALTWTSEWPFSYELQHRPNVASGAWTSLCTNTATGDFMTATDTNLGTQELRYYRVVCWADGPTSEVVFWPSIAATPSLRMSCSQAENLTLTLTWPTEPTYPYVLQYRTDVLSGAWTSLCTNVATSGFMSVTDTIPCGAPQRFYRAICLGVGP